MSWLLNIDRTPRRGSLDYSDKGRRYYKCIAVAIQAMNIAVIHKWHTTGSSSIVGDGTAEVAACG